MFGKRDLVGLFLHKLQVLQGIGRTHIVGLVAWEDDGKENFDEEDMLGTLIWRLVHVVVESNFLAFGLKTTEYGIAAPELQCGPLCSGCRHPGEPIPAEGRTDRLEMP